MNYVDRLAAAIKAEVPAEALPDADTRLLFRLYALLALVKGHAVDAEDVHNAWSVWMQERDPDHTSLRPFSELDGELRKADEPFVNAIRAVVAKSEFESDR